MARVNPCYQPSDQGASQNNHNLIELKIISRRPRKGFGTGEETGTLHGNSFFNVSYVRQPVPYFPAAGEDGQPGVQIFNPHPKQRTIKLCCFLITA
jgi:hypothetical protein